jgi:biopolymer transport protein ExbD
MNADMGDNDFGIQAEINMVPFIDIALVLLIIFMVMTPILVRSQIQVKLPTAAAVSPVPQNAPVEVQVTKAGEILLAGQPVADGQLDEALKALLKNPAEDLVMVEADGAVPFERVVRVMDAAKKLGVIKLGVGVQQKKSTRP